MSFDIESGELIDWVVRGLLELSREPDAIGVYAAEVVKLVARTNPEIES
jgi:hypothetical protein